MRLVTGSVSLSLAQSPNLRQTVPNCRGRAVPCACFAAPPGGSSFYQRNYPNLTLRLHCLLQWADACTCVPQVRSGLQVAQSTVWHQVSCRCPALAPASRRGKYCPFHLRFLAEAVKIINLKTSQPLIQPLSTFGVTE